MCGVIGGFVRDKSTIKSNIDRIYRSQKTRGSDGFGIGVRTPDGALYRERTKEEKDIFNSWVWGNIDNGDYVLFHHRQPTSTPNHELCNHPIANEDESMYLIHNGVLYKDVLVGDHKFETLVTVTMSDSKGKVIKKEGKFTDTELAVHDYEEFLLAGNDYVASMKGLGDDYSSCFMIICKQFDGLLFVANSYPLHAYKLDNNYFLSSEKPTETGSYYSSGGIDLRGDFGYLRESKLFKTSGRFGGSNPHYQSKCTSTVSKEDKKEETKKEETKKESALTVADGKFKDQLNQHCKDTSKNLILIEELSKAFGCNAQCSTCQSLKCFEGINLVQCDTLKSELKKRYSQEVAEFLYAEYIGA